MICKNCGTNCSDSNKFCIICGEPLEAAPSAPSQATVNNVQTESNVYDSRPVAPIAPEPNYDNILRASELTEENLPDKFKPLSAGAYFGYMLLFSLVPCVGWIMAIVFALNDDNINRRNFARGYLIVLAISVVLGIIFGILYTVLISSMIGGVDFYY